MCVSAHRMGLLPDDRHRDGGARQVGAGGDDFVRLSHCRAVGRHDLFDACFRRRVERPGQSVTRSPSNVNVRRREMRDQTEQLVPDATIGRAYLWIRCSVQLETTDSRR